MKRTLVVLVALVSAPALAQPSGGGAPAHAELAPAPPIAPKNIQSIDAKALINGLRLAGVKSTKVKTKTAWSFKTLTCTTEKGDEVSGFDTTACQADGKKVTGAAAIVLMQGMQQSKIPQPYRMGGEKIEAKDVSCSWETDLHKAGESPYQCTYTATARG